MQGFIEITVTDDMINRMQSFVDRCDEFKANYAKHTRRYATLKTKKHWFGQPESTYELYPCKQIDELTPCGLYCNTYIITVDDDGAECARHNILEYPSVPMARKVIQMAKFNNVMLLDDEAIDALRYALKVPADEKKDLTP